MAPSPSPMDAGGMGGAWLGIIPMAGLTVLSYSFREFSDHSARFFLPSTMVIQHDLSVNIWISTRKNMDFIWGVFRN